MTTKDDDEVSTFALDVYWAAGRVNDPALESHVAGCARCRAYLAALDELESPTVPMPAPPRSTRGRRWLVPSGMAAGLALAACALLLVRGQDPSPGYVGAKGTPAVQLLVHRHADTRIWDGRSPVLPGDALALRVACEGLEHVAVAAPSAGTWGRLSDAPCPRPGEALPFTLVVDGVPGDERLAVVLSQHALDDEALREAIAGERRTNELWTVTFLLTKSTESDE